MKRIVLIPVILLTAVLVKCSTIVKKATNDKITFSHKLHVSKMSIDCSTCHHEYGVYFSLPTMDTCEQCHSDMKEPDKCSLCHSNVEKAKPFIFEDVLMPGLNFSHFAHLKKVKNDCFVCHNRIKTSDSIYSNLLPKMITCTQCHDNDVRENKCILCHNNIESPDFVPYRHLSHEGNWLQEHQNLAMADSSKCYQCHKMNFCSDCHSKEEVNRPSVKYPGNVDSSFMHRGDWLSRHAMEAGINPEKCLKCHTVDYCQRCHLQRSVIPSTTPMGGHPAGWLDPSSPDFHGKVARQNALLCASCHEQGNQTICLKCHSR